MEDKFACAVVHELCPICGKSMNEQIIMNTKPSVKGAKEIKEVHNKAIGFSKDACEECSKHKNEVVYIIGVDEKLSKEDNMYRTGQIVGIKKECKFIINSKDFIYTTNNNIQFMFMDEKVGKQLGIF